ncbi:unnamed protein product [Brugia pahangi]|nr:unnamed protein product [Brugia pahangi]
MTRKAQPLENIHSLLIETYLSTKQVYLPPLPIVGLFWYATIYITQLSEFPALLVMLPKRRKDSFSSVCLIEDSTDFQMERTKVEKDLSAFLITWYYILVMSTYHLKCITQLWVTSKFIVRVVRRKRTWSMGIGGAFPAQFNLSNHFGWLFQQCANEPEELNMHGIYNSHIETVDFSDVGGFFKLR